MELYLSSGLCARDFQPWVGLGHESPTTTHHYVEADLRMKERTLARLQEPNAKITRYHASDSLLEFLKTL
jgi:hypothetical protein